MIHQCAARGCHRAPKGYSKYCGSCGQRNYRHGHPNQLGVTKGQLAPYRREVRRFLDGRHDPETWKKTTDRLDLLADRLDEQVRQYEAGRAMNRWQIGAARLFIGVLQDVDPKVIVETCAGMALMYCREPRKFQDDAAFFTQLSRRFLGLTDRWAGTYWSNKTGKMHKVYLDTPRRTALVLGQMLMVSVGVVGQYIARTKAEQERVDREARNALFAALASGERSEGETGAERV
jgi:hypothetical protein